MLSKDDGDAEVVHQALQCGEDFFGRTGVECAGGLVEDKNAGVGGEDSTDGNALSLTARQRHQWPVAHVGKPEQIEGLLYATTHHVRSNSEALHRVGEFLLHRVGDETRHRILGDHAHNVGEVPRRVQPGIAAIDGHAALESATGEVRHQPIDRA